MIGLIYLASALWLGAALTRRLGLKLLPFEAPAMAIGLGLILWTWLSLLCAMVLPYSLSLPLTVVLAAAASFGLSWGKPRWSWQALPGGPAAWMLWVSFTATTVVLLGLLMWTHDLIPAAGGLYSAFATWADFGLHMSLISHFAAADRLSWDFPVAAGANLTYPFMVDLLSAWFIRGGWSAQLALFVPGLLLATAFLQLMLGFGVRLFRRLGGAVFGLTLFLLAGSAAGIIVAWHDFQAAGRPLLEFLKNLPQDYTVLSQPNAQVTNVIADTLLPQRAFLMGFAMFGVVIILLHHLRQAHRPKLNLVTGVFIGLLPLVHAHTFIILMSLVAGLWIEAFAKTRRFFNSWFFLGLAAVGTALPQIIWQSLGNGRGTGGHWAVGWVIQPGETLLAFWTHNYGLMGLIMLTVAGLLIAYRRLHHYLVWYAPIMIIFVLANLYSLQPFAYDNLKLILYAYLMTSLFAAYGALWLIRRSRWTVIPVAVVSLIISASGALAVAHEFQRADLFASNDDIKLAEWIKDSTAPSAVFLTTDRPNQPVATLGGRSIVVGYRGWLYDYHLDYEPRLAAVRQALSGRLTAANPYGAEYLAVSNYEPPEWTVDTTAMNTAYEVVYANPSWTVYRLNR